LSLNTHGIIPCGSSAPEVKKQDTNDTEHEDVGEEEDKSLHARSILFKKKKENMS